MPTLEPDEQAADRERWRLLRKFFPSGWSAKFSRIDLDLYVEDASRLAAKAVSTRVVRLDDARKRQLAGLLDKETRRRERWGISGDIVCIVNERNQRGPSSPDGFLTVAFPNAWCNHAGRLSHLVIQATLAWVKPFLRGRGLGYYLAVAMASYWRDCPIRFPAASKRGIEIEFIADVYSTGGQRLTRVLLSELECMQDEWRMSSSTIPTWAISELIDASDNYDAMRTGSFLAFGKERQGSAAAD